MVYCILGTDRVSLRDLCCQHHSTQESAMQRNVFLAGAAGAIGSRLGPMLVAADYAVSGTTRSPERALELESKGIIPILVNGKRDVSTVVDFADIRF